MKWVAQLIHFLSAAVVCQVYAQDLKPQDLAYKEGQLRRVITVCFVDDAPKREELMGMSTRFIRALSTASAIPVRELEAQAARGTADLAAKAGLMDRCAQIREKGERAVRERDARLGS